MIIRLISDVAVVIQLPDTFMVSSYRCDLAMGHEFPPGNWKRTDEVVALPLNKQRGKQADMRSHEAVITAHPFEQFAIIGQFLDRCFGVHFKPPSNSLLMSSCL